LCRSFSGHPTTANRVHDEAFLVDARFWAQHEMEHVAVFPPMLRTQFWQDLEHGFPETRYLGLDYVDP
jgi:G:T-mismatch repair DNA endonuclease (very short patch repair protein)